MYPSSIYSSGLGELTESYANLADRIKHRSGKPDPPITSIPVKHRWVHPDGTGFIKHLYTFPGLTPKLMNWLEDEFFRRVDNDAAQVEVDPDRETAGAVF